VEIFNIDQNTFAKIVIPTVMALGIIGYFFFRKIIFGFIDLIEKNQSLKKVQNMRQASSRQNNAAIATRKTDLFAQLSAQEKKLHQMAEVLVQRKRFIEAAKVYESINFQRKAIDVLEFNGHIEEAVAILIRMNLPHRAAVLYERNRQYEKAIQCYLRANEKDAVAKCYEKMAENDYHFYQQAGEYYYEAGMIDQCLKAYSKILLSDEILRICLVTEKFEFLCQYLRVSLNASYLLPKMTCEQLELFISSIPLVPSKVQLLATWVSLYPRAELLVPVLKKIVADPELARVYWSLINPQHTSQICHVFAKNPQLLTAADYQNNGKAMISSDRSVYGEYFLKLAPFGGEIPSDASQSAVA